jgi:hypothetical protein
MIATYPDFSKLDLDHMGEIRDFVAQFEPYSDFNFTSIFCWNTDGTTEVSHLNGNLVIRMPDYLDGHLLYSVLGSNQIEATVQELLEVASKLELIPEAVANVLHKHPDYKIIEDEDSFDYTYDMSHLIDMPGSKFKKKRNKANVFVKDHEHYELTVQSYTTLDTQHADKIRALDREWAEQHSRDEGDILPERTALDTLLTNFNALNLVITEVLVNNEIKAFSINEVLGDGYAICHFEKALTTHHQNIFTFLVIQVAKELASLGCNKVNWEQDLGLPGLRRAKSSYHPIRMLKKYTISLHELAG